MDTGGRRATRRHLLGAAVAIPAATLPGLTARAVDVRAAQQSTPESGAFPRTAGAPEWSFAVLTYQDPYTGTIQVPQSSPPGTRYIAAEVEIDNSSDQPLAFTPAEIRVRDDAGTDYRGGTALGTEPAINPRNLNGGERSRGWVWFTVAEGAALAEILYVGPQPQFRIQLTEE